MLNARIAAIMNWSESTAFLNKIITHITLEVNNKFYDAVSKWLIYLCSFLNLHLINFLDQKIVFYKGKEVVSDYLFSNLIILWTAQVERLRCLLHLSVIITQISWSGSIQRDFNELQEGKNPFYIYAHT